MAYRLPRVDRVVSRKKVKAAKVKGSAKTCARLIVETSEHHIAGNSMVYARATYAARDEGVGLIIAQKRRGGKLTVGYAEVTNPRCGVGTRLYEALAAYACENGMTLASDRTLSFMSHGFWKKQVEKGRAVLDKRLRRFVLRDSCLRSLAGP